VSLSLKIIDPFAVFPRQLMMVEMVHGPVAGTHPVVLQALAKRSACIETPPPSGSA
jgi:hypothetical protein